MKTVGIIGGIGPESTIAYYRAIIAAYRDRTQDGSYPQILINSINMTHMLDLIGAGKRDAVAAYLGEQINLIADAGADFGLLASNTPHIVFDDLGAQSPIPLISIVEVTCQFAAQHGIKRAGLFGTRFTMQGGFYHHVFEQRGIEIVVPDKAEQAYIHDKYMNELVHGLVLEETRLKLLKIASRIKAHDEIQGLILGGTELPLILSQEDAPDLLLLDTTQIHVDSIVDRLIATG